MKDHIVAEVRKFRGEHSRLFGNNIDEICKDLYQHQIRSGHRLVRFDGLVKIGSGYRPSPV